MLKKDLIIFFSKYVYVLCLCMCAIGINLQNRSNVIQRQIIILDIIDHSYISFVYIIRIYGENLWKYQN